MAVPQTYANHRQLVPGFHVVLSSMLLVALVGAIVAFVRAWGHGSGRVEAGTVLLLALAAAIGYWYTRTFPLRVQDRAIRAEESLRCYLLTGKPLDARLTLRQVIALRFASDEEWPELARRAADEGLAPDAIKRAVRSWRPDLHRA